MINRVDESTSLEPGLFEKLNQNLQVLNHNILKNNTEIINKTQKPEIITSPSLKRAGLAKSKSTEYFSEEIDNELISD